MHAMLVARELLPLLDFLVPHTPPSSSSRARQDRLWPRRSVCFCCLMSFKVSRFVQHLRRACSNISCMLVSVGAQILMHYHTGLEEQANILFRLTYEPKATLHMSGGSHRIQASFDQHCWSVQLERMRTVQRAMLRQRSSASRVPSMAARWALCR